MERSSWQDAATSTEDARATLLDDFEAHLPGGAGDDLEAGFVVARVEIFALRFHDVHDLLARHFADLRLVRLFRAGGDIRGLLQKDRGGRALRDEGEGLVLKNRDHDREDVAGLLLVAALNSLQNAMMLTPRGPSAVPTGGAGLAWPAGICNLM